MVSRFGDAQFRMRMTPRPRVLAEFFLGVSVEFLKRHDIRMLRGNPLDCLRMPLGVILESDKHIVGENPEFGFRSGWLRVHQSNADETQANDPCEDRGDSRFRDFDAGEGIHGLLVVMSFSGSCQWSRRVRGRRVGLGG